MRNKTFLALPSFNGFAEQVLYLDCLRIAQHDAFNEVATISCHRSYFLNNWNFVGDICH
jgi:hypothetical protein